MAEGETGALPLLPTRELVVFPRMVAPIFVGREKSIKAIESAFSEQDADHPQRPARSPAVEDPVVDDIMPVGTRAMVLQLFKLPDGSIKALVEGQERVRIENYESTSPHFVVNYTPLPPGDRDAGALPVAGAPCDERVRDLRAAQSTGGRRGAVRRQPG